MTIAIVASLRRSRQAACASTDAGVGQGLGEASLIVSFVAARRAGITSGAPGRGRGVCGSAARSALDRARGEDVNRWAVGGDAAVAHGDDPVGVAGGFVEVVQHEDDRLAAFVVEAGEEVEEVEHLDLVGEIKVRRRRAAWSLCPGPAPSRSRLAGAGRLRGGQRGGRAGRSGLSARSPRRRAAGHCGPGAPAAAVGVPARSTARPRSASSRSARSRRSPATRCRATLATRSRASSSSARSSSQRRGDRGATTGPDPVEQGPPRGDLRSARARRADGLQRRGRRDVEGELRAARRRAGAQRRGNPTTA